MALLIVVEDGSCFVCQTKRNILRGWIRWSLGSPAQVQRMEGDEKRRAYELERREAQQAAKCEQELCTMRKVLSRQVAVEHLQGLKENMFLDLNDAGVFADVGSMAGETTAILADVMISSTAAEKLDQHAKMLDIERWRLALIDEAEWQAREEKKEAVSNPLPMDFALSLESAVAKGSRSLGLEALKSDGRQWNCGTESKDKKPVQSQNLWL
eukprot:symbB.v1.2.017603.t1/scaffold1376.1/size122662/3